MSFFIGVKRTSLAPDELITAVVLPDEVPDVQEFRQSRSPQRNGDIDGELCCDAFRRWISGRTWVSGPDPDTRVRG